MYGFLAQLGLSLGMAFTITSMFIGVPHSSGSRCKTNSNNNSYIKIVLRYLCRMFANLTLPSLSSFKTIRIRIEIHQCLPHFCLRIHNKRPILDDFLI